MRNHERPSITSIFEHNLPNTTPTAFLQRIARWQPDDLWNDNQRKPDFPHYRHYFSHGSVAETSNYAEPILKNVPVSAGGYEGLGLAPQGNHAIIGPGDKAPAPFGCVSQTRLHERWGGYSTGERGDGNICPVLSKQLYRAVLRV